MLIVLWVLLGCGCLFFLVKQKWLSPPPAIEKTPFYLMTPVVALFIYVACYILFPPLIQKILYYGQTQGWCTLNSVDTTNVAILIPLPLVWIFFLLFCWMHPIAIQRAIWGQDYTFLSRVQKFMIGAGISFLIYPITILIVTSVDSLAQAITGLPLEEQLAIAQVKSVMQTRWLFISYIVLIVALIPFIEEFLFRGTLQNYFVSLLGQKWGIAATSCVFAAFHYSSKQGIANFGLLLGLFFLSFIMGAVYLRLRSLYATIGMHATFNVLSIALAFF